jgi:hypothetical protein
MSDHAVYSLLRVFTGEKSMTEITNTQVQQEIAEKCAKINNTLAVHRKKWQEFREFWSKPKIAVATLPYGRGVVVGRTSFKAVADQAVEMIEDWVDPQFRNLIPASFQLKYYDSVEHIEEPVLTEIKGKCGFVRMFSKVAFPWPEAFTLADPERVLPFSRGDQILDDANFLVYAALNSDDKYMNWFVMDDDTGEAA